MEREQPILSIVIPCYNESEIFQYCLSQIDNVIFGLLQKGKISKDSYMLFVDDGSKDDTWRQIKNASLNNKSVKGLKLSCNKGHQVALMAGLAYTDSDIIISMDADLQDDVRVIEKMIDEYYQGYDVVYGVRVQRDTDTLFKRMSAKIFYKLMNSLGVRQIYNHADFRLLSRKALDSLLQFREQNMYIRGLVPLVGFNSSQVKYNRLKRLEGETKYPLKKMLSLALNGITSFSIAPLRIISIVGFIISFCSLMSILYAIIMYFLGETIQGWTSMVISIFFLGGVQILFLGVIGEYIGKIYFETKNRPKYFVEEFVGN